MKRVHIVLVCVILMLQLRLHAQEPPLPVNQPKADKPLLFSALPDSFECNDDELQKLVYGTVNAQITAQLSGQFAVNANVVDESRESPANFSKNIKLQNYHNALFNISVRLLADNSTSIQGRIIHPRYGDVLVLYKEDGRYFFKKQLQKLVMPE